MSSKHVSLPVTLAFSVTALLVGSVLGFFAANYLNRSETGSARDGQAHLGVPVQTDQASGMMPDVAEVISAAQSSPGDFDAQLRAAGMYLQIQRADKAEPFLDSASAIGELTVDQTVAVANAYFDIRRFDKARPLYLKALESKPEDLNLRADLGVTFVEGSTPDFARAFAEFEAALRINPRHEPTLHNLGIAQIKNGDRASAEKTLERLEEANPGNELATKLRQALEAQP